jgi:hypothetical protein
MYIIQNNSVSHVPDSLLNQYGPGTYYIFAPITFRPIFKKVLEDSRMQLFRDEMVNPWTVWNNDEKLASIRLQRDYLLKQTDWTALNDVPLSPEEKTAYENYRQQLRDFPDIVDLNLPIEQIIWPTKP